METNSLVITENPYTPEDYKKTLESLELDSQVEAIADEAFEPTEAELVILNASDHEIEAMQAATKLELIFLQVASIAGWENIEIWNPQAIKKSYVGVNLAHPELGIHIPNYVGSIDAIAKVFDLLSLCWGLANFGEISEASLIEKNLNDSENRSWDGNEDGAGETPAIALCNLLLAINPPPITPRRQVEVEINDADGEIESQVLEATFGS